MLRRLALVASAVLLLGAAEPVRTYSLVIGNNAPHEDGATRLRYADDDAVAMYQLLSRLPGESVLLTELDEPTRERWPGITNASPTATRVESELRRMARLVRAARRGGDRAELIFYYSGHGDVGDFGPERKSRRSYINLGEPYDSHRLFEAVSGVPADARHVIIDACHALDLVSGKGPRARSEREAQVERMVQDYTAQASLNAHPRTGVIVATTASRQVPEWPRLEHGVFTYVVRSGLLGGADLDNDRRITYRELHVFARHSFGAVSARQEQLIVRAEPPQADRGAVILDISALGGETSSLRLGHDGIAFGRLDVLRTSGARARPYATVHVGGEMSTELTLLGPGPFRVMRRGSDGCSTYDEAIWSSPEMSGRRFVLTAPPRAPAECLRGPDELFASPITRVTTQIVVDALEHPEARQPASEPPTVPCEHKARVAVMGISERRERSPDDGNRSAIEETLSDTLLGAVHGSLHKGCYDFISRQAVEDVLRTEELRQQLAAGCEESCMAEIAGALDARYLFTGGYSDLGEHTVQWRVSGVDTDRGGSVPRVGRHNGTLLELTTTVGKAATEVVAALGLHPPPLESPPPIPSSKQREDLWFPDVPLTGTGPVWPLWTSAGLGATAITTGILGVVSFMDFLDARDRLNEFDDSSGLFADDAPRGEVEERRRDTLIYLGTSLVTGAAALGVLTYGLLARRDSAAPSAALIATPEGGSVVFVMKF